ncbi:MAG: hypothetical protein AAF191_10860 [Verrucomicrobiota bacterium]
MFPKSTLLLPLLIACALLVSCTAENQQPKAPNSMEKRPETSNRGVPIYTGHLVEKPFMNKAGKVFEHSELYLRLSMGDYFIKFTESNVTRDELLPHRNKVISVEGEIRDGEWDSAPGEEGLVQSRVGDYLAVFSLP